MAANAPLFISFVIYLFSILLLSSKSTSQTTTPYDEKQMLLQIKRDWGDPAALSSWNDSSIASNHCAWAGIQCTGNSVTNITLSSQNIFGPIPPSLCNLKNLSALDLSNNNLPGPFPTSLYNCPALQYLDLSQNLFVGVIPEGVYRLSSDLHYLSLSSNNFTGDIPGSIDRLLGLQVLYLHNNLFNGSFPPELGNLTNLEILTLAANPFAPARIPREFGKLAKLTFLWMTKTNLIGEIPDSFGDLTELQQLDLSENSLSGRIPDGVWTLKNLQYLYLYKNNLYGSINPAIASLDLIEIDVSMNQLNGSIPESFGKLQNLTKLLMYWNRFSGEIPASIAMLPNLYDIRLFNNSLTGTLPPELGKHSVLWNLEVDDNRLSGELPADLCAGGFFFSLVVFNNNLTGNLPETLGKCPTLNNLQIHNNGFTGDVPPGIWSAVNLTTVILRGNALFGALPKELPWNLTRLEIDNNLFSGQIPSSAWKLQVFKAQNNNFSGEIPANLASISQLQILTLGGNQLSGAIPTAISTLKSLMELDLSNNHLVGSIPPAIGSLPVLTYLDLSSNRLSGEIPSAISNLKFSALNLSSNLLSGEVPISLQSPAYDHSFLSNPGLCSADPILNIRACDSQSHGSDRLPVAWIVLLVAGAIGLAIAASFGILMIRDHRRKKNSCDSATWNKTSFQSLDFSQGSILRGLTEENMIGSGGAGRVYRVTLGNRAGEIVAVKKIWSGRKLDAKLEREFNSEVRILGSIRHTNIVKLLCCISSPDSKLLVYEYMANGSLDRWLHENRRTRGCPPGSWDRRLDWPTRLAIAVGAARGLCYMHHDCSPPIVHRDVKSSNILLDSEFRAKVADFGLARMLVRAGEPDSVSVIAGSFGYMAPECAYSGKVNEKVDVYSFGVVLLELVTGKEASDGGKHGSLAEWAWRYIQDGSNVMNAIDEDIRDPSCLDEIAVVLKLGLICTGTLPSTRPSMKEVLEVLLRCKQMPMAFADKAPTTESHRAPLLQTKGGSKHKFSSSSSSGEEEEDNSSIANQCAKQQVIE